MAGVNKVILLGNLGKDPEIRSVEGGRKVANFSLATTESYKNKAGERVDNTEWHNIVFWGPVADVIEKYLKKGSQIYIEGKIRTRSYEDKEGVKKYITEIMGDTLTMLGKPGGGSGENNSGGASSASAGSSRPQSSSAPIGAPMSVEGDSDDLPF